MASKAARRRPGHRGAAEVAQRPGWTHERPDYTDLDAMSEVSRVGDVPTRLRRLVERAAIAARQGPVVLAGSSLGAYISAIASLQVPVAGLFLMVPPTTMGPMPALDAAGCRPVQAGMTTWYRLPA